MSDSIIYEHDSIPKDKESRLPDFYNLIKYNNQVLHIYTESDIKPNAKYQNIMVVKNLNTLKEIKIKVEPNNKVNILPHCLRTFMYLDNILWIGILVNTGPDENFNDEYKYMVYTVNLQTGEIKTIITSKDVCSIKPIGQKYFYFVGNGGIFAWSSLTKLDQPLEPVHVIPDNCVLYSVDWSSSSIAQLANCTYIKTTANSELVELVDSNFVPILTLDVKTWFPNYKPIEPIYNTHTQKQASIYSTIVINNNILLYMEYTNLIENSVYEIKVLGVANFYCWDFTTNTQVEFSSRKLSCFIDNIVPFHDHSNNKIKYLSHEISNNTHWSKIYESG